MMYGIMTLISLMVRQFCLPNPFDCFGDMAILYNWIAGLILAPISFVLVGLVYERGSAPAVGSILYLLVYTVLTGLLWLLGQATFAWWAIVGMIALIVAVVVLIRKISGKTVQW